MRNSPRGYLGYWRYLAPGLTVGFLSGFLHWPPNLEAQTSPDFSRVAEHQVTRGPGGRNLTNLGVWSPDSEWILYDTRSGAAGAVFDGETIEMVNARTGEVRELYRSTDGAHCGAATFHPQKGQVVFMHGPEHPTPDWNYGFWHRRGVMVETDRAGIGINVDACDITPPFTPGALRGGSHVHVWDAAGDWLSFTYEDHVLAQFSAASATNEINQRNVGVSIPGHSILVEKDHRRNHDGAFFTVLVTRTTANPQPGSDEISRACEEGWVGTNGYVRADGVRQRRALAFQGSVLTPSGDTIAEVFLADLPEDLTAPGLGPLAGTEARAPYPPRGVTQRRLTYTADRPFPGIQGPRHWLRSSPDGSRIAFLMKDEAGVVQLWTVSPDGGLRQLTQTPFPIASSFTWSPDGQWIAHVMDNSLCLTNTTTGTTARLTPRSTDDFAPRPEACVFAPDGQKIAFVRRLLSGSESYNQIHVLLLQP